MGVQEKFLVFCVSIQLTTESNTTKTRLIFHLRKLLQYFDFLCIKKMNILCTWEMWSLWLG